SNLNIEYRLIRRAPRPPLFPYTTLFRSLPEREMWNRWLKAGAWIRQIGGALPGISSSVRHAPRRSAPAVAPIIRRWAGPPIPPRSQEHTSELQSRENLVLRLLLEKKKSH